VFYNYNKQGHLVRDCQNATTTCRYCHATDHVIEECPQLISKMQETRQSTTQKNVQKISIERRTDEPLVQVVTRTRITTGNDRGKETTIGAPWVWRVG